MPRTANPTNMPGCLPCRVRKKRCPMIEYNEAGCHACQRFNFHCEGFGEKLPLWAKDRDKVQEYRAVLAQSAKGRSVRPIPLGVVHPSHHQWARSGLQYQRKAPRSMLTTIRPRFFH
ncbi:uncharacterized protein EI90DRAFT_2314567 [Cantharellus anzutake]|uniref:uncharacterized protein n=1 Tax=Cantharellus anzutake TaxID=1750568 RepID=UPI00190480B7|nr:uncharacterized protein EI90DRAFT_2314567 [Cantharellus anzutake]KAF8339988.1 hypothetical protein EI90DRAFT_2314567 [Cantharellus anzutake]